MLRFAKYKPITSFIHHSPCFGCSISGRTSSVAFCSTFAKKEEKRASPIIPKWAFIAYWNPLRPLFNRLNLWYYRRYHDPKFDPVQFMDFARKQYFMLTNAVANEDISTMKKLMTPEAFNELHNVMTRNRQCEKEAWRQFMKLNPVEHAADKESVYSVHFRKLRGPLHSPDSTDSSASIVNETKVFEIYALFSWHHDDTPRKQLIKMGYKGHTVERADVFWPLVISHLGFGKMTAASESDWLITRAHFLIAFPPAPRRSYIFRVTQAARRNNTDRDRLSTVGDDKRSQI